jgi:leucyl aminopeptidase
MNLPRIITHPAHDFSALKAASHTLIVIPESTTLPTGLPARAQWLAVLKRRASKPAELAKTPLAIDLPDGRRMALAMHDAKLSRFEQLTRLRRAVMLLVEDNPAQLSLWAKDATLARDLLFVALVNGVPLPVQKKKTATPVSRIELFSPLELTEIKSIAVLAKANCLARELVNLAPNKLTPASYRQRIRRLAKAQGLLVKEFDVKALQKMGAGAFCAVAQGSAEDDAAIVHVQYRPKKTGKSAGGKSRNIALVGKGICFDTGGHNLKPARYMAGMHKDMHGSAVALALTLAAAELQLPVAIDCWLAIAQNHISATAYKQDDIITALDGTSIEIIHTDAEGRMVLADALSLATRSKPDLVIDFATLTGSMKTALGTRQAGIFATTPSLADLAVASGAASGERVCAFPLAEDYAPALDSKVADIKQCSMEGEADHILAALFLRRFTHECEWIHMDISASRCTGGLGAVATELTGFGVAWGAALIPQWLADA